MLFPLSGRVAAIMLVIVLAANLLLENFVETKVMGRTLESTRSSC